MKKHLLWIAACLLIALSAAGAALAQNAIGGVSPDEAVKYLEAHPEAVIVDVASRRNFEKNHFPGAVNVPIEDISAQEAERMYRELPADRPVLMHCRLGMIVPRAYQDLQRVRSDIPEISYIDGKPPFGAVKPDGKP